MNVPTIKRRQQHRAHVKKYLYKYNKHDEFIVTLWTACSLWLSSSAGPRESRWFMLNSSCLLWDSYSFDVHCVLLPSSEVCGWASRWTIGSFLHHIIDQDLRWKYEGLGMRLGHWTPWVTSLLADFCQDWSTAARDYSNCTSTIQGFSWCWQSCRLNVCTCTWLVSTNVQLGC